MNTRAGGDTGGMKIRWTSEASIDATSSRSIDFSLNGSIFARREDRDSSESE